MGRKNQTSITSGPKSDENPILIELDGLQLPEDEHRGWTAQDYADKNNICVKVARDRVRKLLALGLIRAVGRRVIPDALGSGKGRAMEYRRN